MNLAGSQKYLAILTVCGALLGGPSRSLAAPQGAETSASPGGLGVEDRGIFSDLDDQISLSLPPGLSRSQVRAVHDRRRKILTLYVAGWPTKIYPTGGSATLIVGGHHLSLRPIDHRELRPLLTPGNITTLANGAAPAPGDADGDGIPDPLDLLLGAHKTKLNRAAYGAGYIRIKYPGGDVPRDVGVCTDVVIRAVRNVGIDLQEALHKDIRRAPRSYSMVQKPNAHIDHRRVKTLLPYFKRHWDLRSAELEDSSDPPRPGDIVFMDTFPNRNGPDHIGVLSDSVGPSGHLLVINNWTNGYSTQEMDLLSFIPVTHRFRIRSR